ncbi:MAG: DASS family sodium-coupled anion symporter, partial [Candidatus Korobacteraceae bacterium]
MATESVKEAKAGVSSASGAATQEKKVGGFEAWGKKWGLLLSLAIGLAIWSMPLSGINPTQHKVLAIFGGAVAVWVTMGVNFAVSSLLITTFLYFWVGNPTGALKNGALVRNTDFAISGFSANSPPWLILTGFVISVAMVNTGVAKRLLLHVVRSIGRRPLGAIIAASLTNYLIAPFTPSNTARALAMVPVVEGVAESYHVKRGESNFGRGLALAMAFANNITASAFLTGTIANLMFISSIVAVAGTSKFTSWGFWALAAAPTNLVLLLLVSWYLVKIYPPEMKEISGGMKRIDDDLAAMGPMTAAEKKAISYFLLAIALWGTDQIHGLNATMVAFLVSSLLFLPKIGVLDWKKTQNSLPWELFMFVGGVTTLGNALTQTKSVAVVINAVFASLGLRNFSAFWLLMLLIGFTIFSHVWWSTTTSMTGVMAPIYIGIAQSMGYDVAKFCLPLAIMVAYALFLPFNTNGNMIMLNTGYFSANDLL